MLHVSARDVVFSVCIVRRGAVGARIWEVRVFRHAYVVCLALRDPNERLSAPSICFVCVFVCWKLSPHLGV